VTPIGVPRVPRLTLCSTHPKLALVRTRSQNFTLRYHNNKKRSTLVLDSQIVIPVPKLHPNGAKTPVPPIYHKNNRLSTTVVLDSQILIPVALSPLSEACAKFFENLVLVPVFGPPVRRVPRGARRVVLDTVSRMLSDNFSCFVGLKCQKMLHLSMWKDFCF
jgi:hypothetical protein